MIKIFPGRVINVRGRSFTVKNITPSYVDRKGRNVYKVLCSTSSVEEVIKLVQINGRHEFKIGNEWR